MPLLRSASLLALLTAFVTLSSLGCGGSSTGTGACGDGKVEGTEECDDGNRQSGDGCSPTCKIVSAPSCGDSIVQSADGEQCDDGNTDDSDACTNDCLVARCGDGVIQANLEQCDDGNTSSLDGCTNKCKIAECGDGLVNEGVEQCDDGNDIETDGCTSTCTAGFCGDGVVRTGFEDCDDGNDVDTDLCSNECRAPRCGDGILQEGEACDDDNLVDNDGCTNACQLPACGDGVVQRDEACDDGNQIDDDACSNACETARCGDMIVQEGEQCDDGNMVQEDGCSNVCELPRCGDAIVHAGEQCDDGNSSNNDTCTTACVAAACGDGLLHQGVEQCDDGNLDDGDGCSATCRLPGCGDGLPDMGEECDDGNVSDNDACTNNCKNTFCGDGLVHTGVEECDDGNVSETDACTTSCVAARCGDGYVHQGVEQCDDGNTDPTDFCSNTCTLPVCGNGVTEGGEQCDDGNTTTGDGCSSGCLAELLETEPNNTWQTANPVGVPVEVIGSLPSGDVDYFSFTTTAVVDVRIETFSTDPANTLCAGVDTVVTLLGGDGTTQLGQNDNKTTGTNANLCSRINATSHAAARRLAPGTYFVRVEAFSPGDIAAYKLEIAFTAICGNSTREGTEVCDDGNSNDTDACSNVCLRNPVCGDRKLESPEQCDDGNTTSLDGCSNLCQLEEQAEISPNGNRTQADATGQVITNQGRIRGSISTASDLDYYKFVVTNGPRVFRFETFGPTPYACPTSLDSAITLVSSDGYVMSPSDTSEFHSDLNSGIRNCSAVTYPLSNGTYYVKVEENGRDAVISEYILDVTYFHAGPYETEPNDTLSTSDTIRAPGYYVGARLGGWFFNGDSDFFKFTLEQPMSVHLEIVEDAGACRVGDGTIELEMWLFDANGVELATDDDDGRGACPRIDGLEVNSTGDVGARVLPAGTYYVQLNNKTAFDTYDFRVVLLAR